MPWKEETIMSLKEEFIHHALAQEISFTQLCKTYSITRKTGYRLLDRYKKEGVTGLSPRSKRPLSSPFKTDARIEEMIVETRLKQPTWGPRKIIRYLKNKGENYLPAYSTVNSILKRYNMISMEESLKRKQLIRFEREFPNQLWQMDFKGKFQLLNLRSCFPLVIIDDCSRFDVDLKACESEQCLPIKKRLTYVFKKFGLPDQINVDNGNPWGNSKLLPYTSLTVWLMQLGILVTHSRPRHPQTNGKCERFNRTLKNDLINIQPIRSFSHAQKLFDKWRHFYNHERPHEAIDMDVPAQRYYSSSKAMPSKLPPVEYPENALLRKVRGNGYISFGGNEYLVGEAFKEHLVEIKPNEDEHLISIYFGKFKIYNYDF